MKILVATLLSFGVFSFQAQAADVVCSCPAEQSCSDVSISFIPALPGVYLSVEYAYGNKNQEGFARIIREKQTGRVIYQLNDSFTLIEESGQYSLLNMPQTCE